MFLGSAAQKDDKVIAVLAEIYPVTRAGVYSTFVDTSAYALDFREVALFHSGPHRCHLGCSLRVKLIKPLGERAAVVSGNIFPNHNLFLNHSEKQKLF